MTERPAGTREGVSAVGAVHVPLPPDAQGRPRGAVIVLDRRGHPRAYLDLCRHLPIPLDPSRRYVSEDRHYLVCATHGAQFRVDDGMCERGPCKGQPLHALALREAPDGTLWVTDPDD